MFKFSLYISSVKSTVNPDRRYDCIWTALPSLTCWWSCSRMRGKSPAQRVKPPGLEAGPVSASNLTRTATTAARSTRRPSAARFDICRLPHTPDLRHNRGTIRRLLSCSSGTPFKCSWKPWTPPLRTTSAVSNPMTLSWLSRELPAFTSVKKNYKESH